MFDAALALVFTAIREFPKAIPAST